MMKYKAIRLKNGNVVVPLRWNVYQERLIDELDLDEVVEAITGLIDLDENRIDPREESHLIGYLQSQGWNCTMYWWPDFLTVRVVNDRSFTTAPFYESLEARIKWSNAATRMYWQSLVTARVTLKVIQYTNYREEVASENS